ncbi:MAG: OmpH/Skp family outer membrane protein [Planctomycetota bacterium]
MRKSHLLAAVAAVVVVAACLLSMTLSGSDAAAQSPVRSPGRPQTAPTVVALLDTTYIFKNHTRLKAGMDDLKKRVDAAEAWVKQEQKAILELTEELKRTWKPGTPKYNSEEETIAKRRTTLALKVQQQRRNFLEEESRMYFTVYQEIQQEVNYYCAAKGVSLVLRFSRQGPDPEKPDTVLAYIHKPVVTYAKDLDITDLILNQLNGPAGGGNPNPIGTRPRPGVPFNR